MISRMKEQVGLYQAGKETLPRGHLKILNTGLRQIQHRPGAVESGDRAAVELGQQRIG